MVTSFQKTGVFWKSYEGHLNATQTGFNSSVPFDFSIDNDDEDPKVVATLDSAARFGYKVKLNYHQTIGKNWFQNRGETNHFILSCDIVDRNPMGAFNGSQNSIPVNAGHVIDTIFVVIDKSQLKR